MRKLILRDLKAVAGSENCAKAGKHVRLLRGERGFQGCDSDVKTKNMFSFHTVIPELCHLVIIGDGGGGGDGGMGGGGSGVEWGNNR